MTTTSIKAQRQFIATCGKAKLSPRLRVLVVEDVRDTADTFALLIRTMGHETRVVRETVRALSTAREFRPDVAFLDIGMPGIDGLELAGMLRKEFGEKIWICAATGYGTRADRSRAHQCGFDAYLVKPIPPACVEEMLKARALDLEEARCDVDDLPGVRSSRVCADDSVQSRTRSRLPAGHL